MKKIVSFKKIIFASLLCFLFAFLALTFVGCGDKYANMTLVLSKSEITLELVDGVSTEENVVVTIGGDASISREVYVHSDSSQLTIRTSMNSNNQTVITVTSTTVCQNQIVTVRSMEGNKTATFVVNVIVPVESVSVTTNEQKLFVVKGTPRTLSVADLIVFEPSNTTQKDITFSILTSTARAEIRNNILTVYDDYPYSTIEIEAKSSYLGTSGVKTFTLDVLSKDTISFESICYPNDTISSTNSLLGVDKTLPTTIRMTSNIAMWKTVEFTIYISSSQAFSITPYIKSTGTYQSQNLSFDSGTLKSITTTDGTVTEYVVSLSCGDNVSSDEIFFKISYNNYDFSYETNSIIIKVEERVKDIQTYINGTLSSTNALTVYDKYLGTQGLQLSFEALPTTLSSTDRTLILSLGQNAGNFWFWKKGQTLALNDLNDNKFVDNKIEINSGDIIYVSAKDGTQPSGSISITSKNNDVIEKTFTLIAKPGVSSMQFVNFAKTTEELNGDISYHYYIASNQTTQQSLKFTTDVMDISGLTIELSGNSVTLESNPVQEIDCFSFIIQSVQNAEDTTIITLKQENGYYVKAYVHATYQLQEDEIVFSVPSSQTSASVGYLERQINVDWQFKVGIKKDHSVTLTRDGKGVTSVKYSYCEILKSDEISNYDTFFNNVNFNEITFLSGSAPDNYDVQVIDENYLNLNQLIITNVGKLIVKAEVSGNEIIINEKGVADIASKSFVTYFFIEGYIPVENYQLSQSVVNLYAKDSVGYDDLSLTKTKVQLLLNDSTYQTITWLNVAETKQENGKLIYKTSFENNNKDLNIEALSTWANVDGVMIEQDMLTFTFQVIITEFTNTEYRLALTVNILKAQKVEKIIVENVNVNNGIYLPLTYSGKDIVRTINAVVQVGESGKLPYNTDLVYEFLPNYSISSNSVSLNKRTGQLTVTSTTQSGGVGKIRIAPADRYNENNIYVADENDVAVYIDVVLADGQSRETSYRITKLSDIDNYVTDNLPANTMHITLMNDIEINTTDNFALFDTFYGGLYGAIQGDTNYATITINKTLCNELATNACIKDLIICGEVSGSAFITVTNNGTIQNVTIDAISGEQKQYATPSVLNATGEVVGGICATNEGVVDNCLFSGQIVSSNAVVGGIVGINTKTISNCAVEFYSYAKLEDESVTYSYGKITATSGYVGGIVGQMESNSTLTNSYAKSYVETNETLMTGTKFGGLVGNFVAGNVDVCFAEIDKIQNLFGQQIEGAIVNAYILFDNSGTQDGTYFVDGTQKTLAEAEASITTGKIWLNEKNDDSVWPTFKNVNAVTPISDIASTFEDSEKTISQAVDEQSSIAIMFYYDVKATLTLQETFALDDLNFVSFEDLFGENSYGIRAISSNSQIISTSSTGLNIKGTGKVNITFYSKYNAKLTKNFDVYVLNPVSNLTFVSNNLEFGNNSVVNAKSTQGFSFIAKIDNSVLLDDCYQQYEVNNFEIVIEKLTDPEDKNNEITIDEENYLTYFSGDKMGPVTVQTQKLLIGKNYITYSIELGDEYADDVNNLLKTNFKGTFALNVYQGADKVELNISDISIEPIDEVELQVVVLTDDKNDALSIVLAPNANYPQDLFNIVISEDKIIEYYLDADCNQSCLESEANYFKITFTVKFAINDNYKNLNFDNAVFNFTINATSAQSNTATFGTKELAKLFVINVSNQQIVSASVAHYKNTEKIVLKDETTNNNFVLYKYNTDMTDTTIEPGKEGLLKIDLYPTYAKYDYITVTYSTLNNKNLKMYLSFMEKYTKNAQSGFRQSAKNVTDLDNGIKIFVDNITDVSDLSTIYLGTYIPLSIEEDVVFVLKLSAYNNDELVKETQFNLVVEYTSGAILSVVDYSGNELSATCPGSEQILKVTIPKANDTKIYALNIYGIDDPNGDPDAQEELTLLQVVEDTLSLTKTYKYSLSFGENIEIENDANYITIEATLTWMVNGKAQYKTTTYTLAIVDFLINNVQLSTTRTDKTTFYSYIGIQNTLQFEFSGMNITESASEDDPFNTFLKNCYYEDITDNTYGNYIVNYGKKGANTFLRNLYYVEGSIMTPLCNSDNSYNTNSYFTFAEEDGKIVITGKQQGEINLRFVLQTQYPSKSKILLKEKYFDFTFVISPFSDEDLPLIIDSETSFWEAVNGDTAQNYILMSDLYLENVSPSNTTAIDSLDGNNYTIHILSWNTDTTSSNLDIALFNNVTENTTLKNLTINVYHATNIVVDTNTVSTLNVAGLAITNTGIIYNCEVVAYKSVDNSITQTNAGINISYSTDQIADNITSNVAGFVVTNNGYITNSRVGGTTLEKTDGQAQKLEAFNIVAQGNISGFVDVNAGTISSCFFNNATLTNTLTSGRTTATSGFARNNNGTITGSYAKGTGDKAYSITGQGITTASIGAGFVYSNDGTVANCYSNILLATLVSSITQSYESGRLSAGFVYNNAGTIEVCYTASKIETAKSTQMAFVGVNEEGNILNTGTIKYAYYYTSENIEGDAYSNSTSKLNIVRISNPTDDDNFYGFSFATSTDDIDGVWVINGYGPDLVSANQIAISKRYIANVRYDSQTSEVLSYNLPYQEGYEYGSIKNPIIIRTAEEYNTAFGGNNATAGTAISNYYSLGDNYVFGNYRIVSDINLQELNPDSSQNINIASTQMELRGGVIDGNMMTITGIDLTASTDNADNFGLFASLTENACIKNLTLSVINVSAIKVKFVGALAGSVTDSKVINISVQKQNLTENAVIRGNNVVGGLIGLVKGESDVKSIVVDSLIVKANEFVTESTQNYNRSVLNSPLSKFFVSYAGGVIGIADIYTVAEENSYEHSTDSNVAELSYIIAKGEMQVYASTVGGVIGYLGPQTTLCDTTFEVSATSTSKIIAYNFYAGGIVGECYGNIDMARAEHDDVTQKEIENNVSAYYHNPASTIERGNMSLFEDVADGSVTSAYSPIAIGGLVGLLSTGEIQHSYSKINVRNSNVKYAGGVVGQISSIDYPKLSQNEITFFEVYAFGDVYTEKKVSDDADKKYAVGGIVGYIDSNRKVSMAKVNAVNYWSVEYNAEDKTYELPDNLYQIYAMTNATNSTILELNDIVDYNSEDESFTFKNSDYSLPAISFTATNDFMFAITEVMFNNNFSVVSKYVNSAFATTTIGGNDIYLMVVDPTHNPITGEKISTEDFSNSQAVTPYYELDNVEINGAKMDAYFIQAGWDSNYWVRYTETNDLFPSLVTYAGSMTYYIDVESDIQKMLYHPYATFIVRALDQPLVEGKHLVKIGNYIKSTGIELVNFSGTLKGLDNTQNYGFDFEYQTSFITKTVGANFKNLTMMHLGSQGTEKVTEVNQAFVDYATFTSFENMLFEECYSNTLVSQDNSNIGLLANYMKGGYLSNVSMLNCGIKAHLNSNDDFSTESTSSDEVNIGIVCGKIEGSGSAIFQIQDVCVYQTPGQFEAMKVTNAIELNINENVDLENLAVNIGAIIGQTSGKIVTSYSSTSSTGNYLKGIGVAGVLVGRGVANNNYQPQNPSTTTANYGTTLKITGTGLIGEANVGMMFGKAGNSTISYSRTSSLHALQIVGNISCTEPDIKQANIGGIIGSSTTSLAISSVSTTSTKYVNVDVNMNINAENINAGMIAGKSAKTYTINNIDTYGKINIEALTADTIQNVGGFIGEATGNLTITNTISRTYITFTGDKTTAKLGGFIGDYKNGSLNIGKEDDKTKYLGQIVFNADIVYAGGLVGLLSNSASAVLNNAVFGGIIQLSKSEKKTGSIYAGGLIGDVSSATTEIKNCISYGELNLLTNTTNIKEDNESIYIYLGGLLGRGNSSTSLSNNVSVSTVASKTSVTLDDVKINAIVGDANGASGSNNFYSHQVSLCLDLNEEDIGAVNEYYPDLSAITVVLDEETQSLEYNLKKYISTLTSTSEQNEEWSLGSKLHPYVVKNVDEWIAKTKIIDREDTKTKLFVVLSTSIENNELYIEDKGTPKAIKNAQIVGNGTKIYSQNALFSIIDETSSVSGLSVKPNIENATSTFDTTLNMTGLGTIANINHGYVFACTVVSDKISAHNNYELTIPSSVIGGGLVGVNDGVVMDCMTSININGNASSSGLVGYNKGVIISSYSVGKIVDGYAFSNGDGEVYDSYTASPASAGVFGQNATVTNSFFDIYAVGCVDNRTNESDSIASTNKVSILDTITDSENKALINISDIFTNSKNNLKFGYVAGKNFGYPTFSATPYEDFAYMQGIDTGDGTTTNTPIMINSVGKLQQISLASELNLNYEIIYDLSFTNAMTKSVDTSNIFALTDKFNVANWLPISNFKGTITGVYNSAYSYKISNLTTNGEGITNWAVFGEVGDNASTAKIEYIEFEFGSLEINVSNLATVATSITKTTLDNIKVTASTIKTTSSGSSGDTSLSGLVGKVTASTISNVTLNITNMEGGKFMGGLIAKLEETTADISNVTFESDLTITITVDDANAGGLFGNVAGNLEVSTTEIKGVTFKTIESGTASQQAISFTAGGIAGVANGLNISTGNDTESAGITINGNISLDANTTKQIVFGGLVGEGKGSTNLHSGNISFNDDTYTITITQSGTQNGTAIIAGGIAGKLTDGAMVQNLSVKSTLTITNETEITFGGIAGIIAEDYTSSINDTNFAEAVKVDSGYSLNNVIIQLKDDTQDKKLSLNEKENYIGGVVGQILAGCVLAENKDTSISGDFNFEVQESTKIGAIAGVINGGKVKNITLDSSAGIELTGVSVGAIAGEIQQGMLENVTVKKADITGLYNGITAYVGAIASKISGGDNTTLDNVNVESGVNIKTKLIDSTIKITEDTTKSNKLKANGVTTYMGGFAGELSAYMGSMCTSTANITLQTAGYAGGIAGTLTGWGKDEQIGRLLVKAEEVKAYISDATNWDNSEGIDNYNNSIYIGGIAGEFSNGKLVRSYFVNKIVSSNVPAYIGGIAGKASGSMLYVAVSGTIAQDIDNPTSNQQDSLNSAVGGIVGCANSLNIQQASVGPEKIEVNGEELEGYDNDTTIVGSYIAGGLVGTGSVEISSNCTNHATVSAGNLEEETVTSSTEETTTESIAYKNCTTSYAGGICGTASGKITGATNYGDVRSGIKANTNDYPKEAYAGGIVGYAGGIVAKFAGTSITNSVNSGTVQAGFANGLDEGQKLNARDLYWWDGENDDEDDTYKTALRNKIQAKVDAINNVSGTDTSYAGGICGCIEEGNITSTTENNSVVYAEAKTILSLKTTSRYENLGYDAWCYYATETCNAYATGIAYKSASATVDGTNNGTTTGGYMIEFNIFSTDNYHGAGINNNIYYSYILDYGFDKNGSTNPEDYTLWHSFATLYEPYGSYDSDRAEDFKAWVTAYENGLSIAGAKELKDYERDGNDLVYYFGDLKFQKDLSSYTFNNLKSRGNDGCYLLNDEYGLILGPVKSELYNSQDGEHFDLIYCIPQEVSGDNKKGFYYKPNADGTSCTKVPIWASQTEYTDGGFMKESDWTWTDGVNEWIGFNQHAPEVSLDIELKSSGGPSKVEPEQSSSNIYAYDITNDGAINYSKFDSASSGEEYSFVNNKLQTVDLPICRNENDIDENSQATPTSDFDTILVESEPISGQAIWQEGDNISDLNNGTPNEYDIGKPIWYIILNGSTYKYAAHWGADGYLYDNSIIPQKLYPTNGKSYQNGEGITTKTAMYTLYSYTRSTT